VAKLAVDDQEHFLERIGIAVTSRLQSLRDFVHRLRPIAYVG
jgi:hypothetical protein